MEPQGTKDLPKQFVEASLHDQHFLLNFIMSNYLGPDVTSDNPKRSASQRLAEGLLPYSMDDLGRSFVSIIELEGLYYYALRNAHPNLVLKLNLLHMYLKGNLLLPNSGLQDEIEQFTSFFPSNLHEQTSFLSSTMIVKGIVIIDDPITSYIQQEELERFRRLSGTSSLKIDVDEFSKYQHEYWTGREESQQQFMKSFGETMTGNIFKENCYSPSPVKPQDESRKRRRPDPCQMQVPPTSLDSQNLSEKANVPRICNSGDRPAMMPLLSLPKVEDCTSKASIVLTGTARKGTGGPPVGVVDIGVSEAAYFFQVALPGVRKNGQLSCEVECDGKVHIRGLSSTGGSTITKESHVYHMNLQQLCPPGPFTLSFSLPGPVDPRLFSPKFRDDGIFEAVVVKLKEEVPGPSVHNRS